MEVFGLSEGELFDSESGGDSSDELLLRQALHGRFALQHQLGQGGTGVVYEALDLRLGRPIALKIVHPEATAGIGPDPLLREVSHVARLHHPNILPLHDVGYEAGHPFLVMPLVRDGSLRHLVQRRGRLPIVEAVELLGGIAAALDHAHSRQVLHCDVKPENVLLHGRHPFVMDFGIAQRLQSEAEEWREYRGIVAYSAGTPAYVSPEQAAGDAVDERTDVYSLACMAYELLSGQVPFHGTTTRDMVTRRFRNPPPRLHEVLAEIPAAVSDVVVRAMSFKPGDRPDRPGAFAAELRAAAEGRRGWVGLPGPLTARLATRAQSRLGIRGPARMASPLLSGVHDMVAVFRSLRREWRFSLSVILMLGLGLGVGLPVLGVADRLLLRPPSGIRAPDGFVKLIKVSTSRGRPIYNSSMTGLDLTVFSQIRSVEGVSAVMPLDLSLGTGADSRPIRALLATSNFFPLAGVPLHLGRVWTDAEDRVGAATAPVVLGHAFWTREFAGSSDVLGRTLRIGTGDYVVSGVAPEGFHGVGLGTVDVYLPIHVTGTSWQGGSPTLWTTDGSAWLRLYARVRAGVTASAVERDALALYRQPGAYSRDPDRTSLIRVESVVPGQAIEPSRAASTARWLGMGGALLLVLIWANLTGLFAARSGSRIRDDAVRLALGGTVGAVGRIYAVEAVLLAVLGAGLGLVLSGPAMRLLHEQLIPSAPVPTATGDGRLLLLTFGLVAVSAVSVMFGSALRLRRTDPAVLLRSSGDGRGGVAPSTVRSRGVLLLVQATVFCVLAVGALAFVRSLVRALGVDHGFSPAGVVYASLPELERDDAPTRRAAILQQVVADVRRLPSVEAASLAFTVPWRSNATTDARLPGADSSISVYLDVVSPEHLQVIGWRLQQGRWFQSSDAEGAERVAVINASLAAMVARTSGSVLGQCVHLGADSIPCARIVGVIKDARMSGRIDSPMDPGVILPIAQAGVFSRNHLVKLFARVATPGPAHQRAVSEAVRRHAPDATLIRVVSLLDEMDFMVGSLRLGTIAFSLFGVLAVVVAGVGLSGMIAYLLRLRRRALAIQVALGAPVGRLLVPLVTSSVGWVFAGMIVGTVILMVVRPLVDPLLFRTSIVDLMPLVLILGLGVALAVLMAAGPLRAILRRSQMDVLREEG
jgi:putative ABC transport system permease protein